MKTFTFTLVLLAAGCASTPTMQCQPSIMCGTSTVQVCCTTTQCQYQVSGMTFPCTGTDCTMAAAQVRAFCPDSGVVAADAGATDTGIDAGIDAGP